MSAQITVRRDVTSIAALRGAGSLAFFLSTERIGIRIAGMSPAVSRGIERRLDRLQSVCGCITSTIGLLVGVGFGLQKGASVYAICAYGIGFAAMTKVATIAIAYFLYRGCLTRLCRRIQIADLSAIA